MQTMTTGLSQYLHVFFQNSWAKNFDQFHSKIPQKSISIWKMDIDFLGCFWGSQMNIETLFTQSFLLGKKSNSKTFYLYENVY